MPEFGMPTLVENKTLEENVALCKQLDLSFLELNIADFNLLVHNTYLEMVRRTIDVAKHFVFPPKKINLET